MARRGPMHDVELVDDDEPGAPPEPTPAPAGHRPWRRAALLVGAAVLAVAVTAGVVGHVVQDRRDRARLAALADHPGVVAVQDDAPEVLWEVLAPDTMPPAQVRTADDLLVGVQPSPRGPVTVVATDVVTGTQAWRAELLDGAGRPEVDSGVPAYLRSGGCATVPAAPHLVVCLAHDGVEGYRGNEYVRLPPTTARLVTLDTRDGSVVTELTDALATTSPPTSLVTVRDQVVVLAEGAEIELQALTTQGAAAWRTSVPTPAPVVEGWTDTRLVVVDGTLALVTLEEVRVLDAEGGTVRSVPRLERYVVGGNGTLALQPSTQASADADPATLPAEARTTVVRADRDVDVIGTFAHTDVDDGSVPELVLTDVQGHLTAWDADGEQLWSAPVSTPDRTLVLDRRIHLVDDAELVALDARTGAELWRSRATTTLPVTDGTHLLAVARAAPWDPPTEIVALDPADGAEVWRGPLPEGTDHVEAHLGLLLAYERAADWSHERVSVLG